MTCQSTRFDDIGVAHVLKCVICTLNGKIDACGVTNTILDLGSVNVERNAVDDDSVFHGCLLVSSYGSIVSP